MGFRLPRFAFTGINKKTGVFDAIKYLHFDLQGEAIEPYMYDEAMKIARYPILLGKRPLKELIKYMIGREPSISNELAPHDYELNPMDDAQLNADANGWIDGWKNQFSINDLEAPLTPKNAEGRKIRINVMRELVDFCTDRGYNPIFVIPPVTENLARYYTPRFEETYIYSFLKDINRDIRVLDYSKEEDLQNKDLYFNSFFLNRKGREKFTRRVMIDLGLMSNVQF